MSFDTALSLTLLLVVVVLACTMANLLARITRLERFARQVAGLAVPPQPAGDQPAPPELATAVKGRDPARVLFLSQRCPACDEAVDQVQQWPDDARRATVLLYRDEPPDDLVAPPGVRVVPRAGAVFEALTVTGTPTFVHVDGGMVVGRTTGFMVHSERSTPQQNQQNQPNQETARA
jgi:hypothetical protein